MPEQRDLGITLVGATLLLLGVSYLTQCTSAAPRPRPITAASPPAAASSPAREAEGRRRSIQEIAEEEDKEESERVKSIGHALQTIAADPEKRRTYGFPP